MQQDKTNNISLEEKITLLEKDFLERDGDTYVRIRTTGRLGWEDTLPKESAYSEAILHPKSSRDLYLNAMSIARNMITSMGHPYKVTIKVNDNDNCTNSKTVWVATKVFDDESLSLGKRLDVFIGETVHEGSHLLYSDFELFKTMPNNRVLHSLQNVVEDEMIERRLGEDCPGLANFLKATKYYYFGKAQKEQAKNLDKLTRCFNAILSIVRYPACLTREETEEFVDILLEVRNILTPYPENTAQAIEAAEKIYELIKEFIQDQQDNEEGEGDESDQDGDGQDRNEQDGDGQPNSGGKGGNKKKSTKKVKITDEEIEKILEKAIQAIENNIRDAQQKIEEKDMSEDLKKDCHREAREADGEIEIGENAIIVPKKPYKTEYRKTVNAVRKYIPAVSKALCIHGHERNTVQTGLRRGILDGNKIAEAIQGQKNVYCRQEIIRPDRVNICLLIDESGSMSGTNEILARQTAVLINEAVGNVPNVELNIYGYTNEYYDICLFPYREWGCPFNPETLGSITAIGGTPTAEAIRECVKRVRRKSQTKSVLLVISDGYANDGCYSVRKAVDEAKQNNMETIGISISSNLGQNELRQMYDQWVDMSNLQNLVKGIATIVKKIVIKTQSRTYAA